MNSNTKDTQTENNNNNTSNANNKETYILSPPLQSLTPKPIIEKFNTYSHICNICGKGFNNGVALGGHKSSHKKARNIYNKLPSPIHTHTTSNNYQLKIKDNLLKCIPMKTYSNTNDYEFFCDSEILSNKITCIGNCCNSLNTLGPYNLYSEKWETLCKCRSLSMECNSECKCDTLKCKNRNIINNKYKQLNKSIHEQQVFGIDEIKIIYNNNNIMIQYHMNDPKYKSNYYPKLMNKPNESEADFMLTDVLRTILNMSQDQLINDCSSITKSKRKISFDDIDINIYNCKFLDNIMNGEDMVCHDKFPIYSKGTGVICIHKNGIEKNVVYSPWVWYEKADRIRCGAQKQPEFFNIQMEKHKDDINGYDLVFIDPSKKGIYASRLSHSCNPNCIMNANDNKHNIGVYASKNIKYGGELCFNYNNVTENEKEWKDSMNNCDGQFLMYAGTNLYSSANLFNCNVFRNVLNKYSLRETGVLLGYGYKFVFCVSVFSHSLAFVEMHVIDSI